MQTRMFRPVPPKPSGREPLAARMRPRSLDEYVGQEHILGPGRILRRAIESDRVSSIILWGPPGIGKTTLATVIANVTQSHFDLAQRRHWPASPTSARSSARRRTRMRTSGERTILLVDEIHRFNKAQQDALLPHVEDGTIILIGATTENPYFEVIGPLVSRCRVFQLQPLTEDDLVGLMRRALADPERGLGRIPLEVDDDALGHIARLAGGDARVALNALESAATTTPADRQGRVHVTLAEAEQAMQRRALLYDKDGDAHYDTISAFIKSMRGSDPDAALYWMAKMIYAGEDPRFIARRMIIFASEDVGLADPQALLVAVAAAQALRVGGAAGGAVPPGRGGALPGDGAQEQLRRRLLRGAGGRGARGADRRAAPPAGRQPRRRGARPRRGLPVPARLPRPLGAPAVPTRLHARPRLLRAGRPRLRARGGGEDGGAAGDGREG